MFQRAVGFMHAALFSFSPYEAVSIGLINSRSKSLVSELFPGFAKHFSERQERFFLLNKTPKVPFPMIVSVISIDILLLDCIII